MNQSNYALLTALYDSQSSDLYKDIYFPIIKYSIFLLYQKQKDTTKYYDTTNIQEVIIEKFGIKIPLIVIKQSLKIISNEHPDFEIKLLKNGDQLSIKKIWDVAISDSIERVYEQNLEHFTALQNAFMRYIEVEQLQTGVNFIDFFSNNTEDIYHYINNDTASEIAVNENYIHIVNFLKWLKKHDSTLYDIAADIFWGSIVAAFLQREIDFNIKPEAQVSYYLDSSLILALLDLDSLANNLYCTELISMITASGHRPYVHPLTIREIDSILYSVERDGAPKPNSGIAEAYDRRSLSPSKILQIRQKLKTLIADSSVYIETCSDAQVDEIQNIYKSKSSVRNLAATRTNTYSDNIRDIHDVFMYDFIRAKNNKCISVEKSNTFFVTLNAELIKYYKDQKQDSYILPIIHPARIVMDLWIHNSKTTNIRRNALTEVIARCTALNQTDVRRKLRLISKHYKENEFSEENYKAVYIALMNRSKQVMSEIDMIQNQGESEETIYQRIENIIRTALREEEQRRSQSLDHQRKVDVLLQNIKQIEDQRNMISDENVRNQKLLKLNEELNSWQEKLNDANLTIEKLEKARDRNICMWRYWVSIAIQLICIILIIIFGLRYIRIGINNVKTLKDFADQNIGLVISIVGSILSLIAGDRAKLSILRPIRAYKRHRKMLSQEWNEDNPQYGKTKCERDILIKEIKNLKSHIKDLKNG